MKQHQKFITWARRLFAEQEARVREQEELILSLRAKGQPTDVAEEKLTSMNRTLTMLLGEIARLARVGPDYTN